MLVPCMMDAPGRAGLAARVHPPDGYSDRVRPLARLTGMPARGFADGGRNIKPANPTRTVELPRISTAPAGAVDQGPPIHFREAASCGIEFTHVSGMDADRNFPTNFGSGVAIFDYDGDGWHDVYLATTKSLAPNPGSNAGGNRLYRNRGDQTFEDVTARAGVGFQASRTASRRAT